MAEVSLTGAQMLLVLEAVVEHGPISAAEAARICNMNRTVTHRLLVTLAQRSYVRRGDKGYTIGATILRLAQYGDRHIRLVVKPIIETLARECDETVVVHGISDFDAVVLEQAVGQRHLVRVEHRPGSHHPLYTGASGWSLLAFQPERFIAKILDKVSDRDAVRARIEEVRRDGYAVSHDELQLGVHGVAVPVFNTEGTCEISLAVLVPGTRANSLLRFIEPLQAAAREVASNMYPSSREDRAAG